jgi:hypothetical protein
MRFPAFGLIRALKLGLVPSFMLSLLIGCDSGGPGVSAPPSGTGETASKSPPPTRTQEERRKLPRGTNRAAAGVQPSGAE